MSEQPLIDSRHEKILSLPDETRFAPNGVVSRTLVRTANSRTVLFGFAEGQELTEHTSTQHALIQILSGECEFSLAGKPRPLKPGDLLYMPPNLSHAVKATRQFSMLLTLFKPEPAENPRPTSDTPSTLNPQPSTLNFCKPQPPHMTTSTSSPRRTCSCWVGFAPSSWAQSIKHEH